MPSWGMHLTTAYAVACKIENETIKKNKNDFIIGNFLADAERYVVKDFSIFVPYDISHFAKKIKINGRMENLPCYTDFIEKYKEKLDNPVVLGYLTHLLTDFYWNELVDKKYTKTNKDGEITGVLANEKVYIKGDSELRRIYKQRDFGMFDKEVLQNTEYEIPKILNSTMKYVKQLKETQYNVEDIEKIIDYLDNMVTNKEKIIPEYKLFTQEKLIEYFDKSIEFILNNLKYRTK